MQADKVGDTYRRLLAQIHELETREPCDVSRDNARLVWKTNNYTKYLYVSTHEMVGPDAFFEQCWGRHAKSLRWPEPKALADWLAELTAWHQENFAGVSFGNSLVVETEVTAWGYRCFLRITDYPWKTPLTWSEMWGAGPWGAVSGISCSRLVQDIPAAKWQAHAAELREAPVAPMFRVVDMATVNPVTFTPNPKDMSAAAVRFFQMQQAASELVKGRA